MAPRRSRRWLWGGACVVSVLLAGVTAAGLAGRWGDLEKLPVRVATRWAAPRPGQLLDLDRRERAALRHLGERLQGRLVWSSNRAGNHELYLLVIDGRQPRVQRLTDNPYVDFSARFSPDGNWIAFARSRREWVSFREIDAWDLYVMRADGTDERRLVEHGYHPTWSAQGSSVIFQRGARAIEIDIGTGTESVLFDSDVVLGGRGWGEQALLADRSLLAIAVQRAGAIVLEPGGDEFRHLTLSQVCQTTWVPGTRDLLWVEPQGNGGTRIARAAADGSRREVFMDLPGERSHEYFPALSDDGKWMVWGAAAAGHEHDRADYEIYIWQVGDPWDSATRVTYYTGNDQWPDLHLDRH